MELSSNSIPPLTSEELRAARVNKFASKSAEPLVISGADSQGHSIVPIAGGGIVSQEHAITTTGQVINGSFNVQKVSSPAEEVQQNLEHEITAARQFEDTLKTWLNIAPTMALIRACDTLSEESAKIITPNPGLNFSQVKMILNNGQPPIRIAIPDPLDSNKWTSIVPPIIPAGIKVLVPKQGGETGWEELETPDRNPDAEENQKIRRLLQDASTLLYGSEEGQQKMPLGEEAVAFSDVANLALDDDSTEGEESSQVSKTIALTERATQKESAREQSDREQVDQMLAQGKRHLESPYIGFLNLLSDSAGVVARSAVAIVGGGGIAIGTGMGERSTQAAGAVEKFIEEKAPAVSLIPPITMVPVMTGFFIGGVVGTITSIPGSIKKAFEYFSVGKRLEKVGSAFFHFGSEAVQVLSLMEEANRADEEVKTTLQKSFEAFHQVPSLSSTKSPEFQQLIEKKNLLIHQIDKRIEYRSRSINSLKKQIAQKRKHEKENLITSNGPVYTSSGKPRYGARF
ncbi:MAG: hypothetical protein FJ390_02620 [Verrucomicrobia bacterium]|nr:hypothetical protein [Verrucomicrobiota bacterium]